MIKQGDIVLLKGHTSPFKVLAISADGKSAEIQFFSLSKQQLLGGEMRGVPCSALSPFKEDASQAAARIVKEATDH